MIHVLVCDFSCGTGVAGITLRLLFENLDITFTDKEILLPLIKENVKLNEVDGKVQKLEWGNDVSILGENFPFDVVNFSKF